MTPLWEDLSSAYPVTLSVAHQHDRLRLGLYQYADEPAHAAAVLGRWAHFLNKLTRTDANDLVAELIDEQPLVLPARETRVAPEPTSAARRRNPGMATPTRLAGRFDMPKAVIRQLVIEQFERALEQDKVNGATDFFAAGGTSLDAARMHAGLCQALGLAVPLLSLYEKPTVDGLVDTLAGQAWPHQALSVTTLQEGRGGVPLYCVASPEVNTLGYFMLTRHLPAEQPVHVIQLPPETERPQPVDPVDIESMADAYVGALLNFAPDGPYGLLGMCGGAHLATSMARKLGATGRAVPFFGVINTWSLYTVSRVYYLHRARRVLDYYLGRVRDLLPVKRAPVKANPLYVEVEDPDAQFVGLGNPWIRDVGFAHKRPSITPIALKAHVFRIHNQQYWRVNDKALGWGQFFEHCKTVDLPGDVHHELMREPHIASLANAIGEALGTADETRAHAKMTHIVPSASPTSRASRTH
ncbi:MAG: thioesterase domain-containing protein [Pseudomonadota bacterium]